MRPILVDNARRKRREKHGGGRRREPMDPEALPADGRAEELLDLHEALEHFVLQDPPKARLVELRSFGGLTLEQAAACLGISPSTADRAWRPRGRSSQPRARSHDQASQTDHLGTSAVPIPSNKTCQVH
jgi:DNA-directed RNA polymerase specialized sigma24 family protein